MSDSLKIFNNIKKKWQSVVLEVFQLEALVRLDGCPLLPNRPPDRGQTAPFPLTERQSNVTFAQTPPSRLDRSQGAVISSTLS